MYTVIVVDDEWDLRKALIRKVKWDEIGFQVIGEAENGIEALELVEKLEPDLLLTDVKMPFMTGIELAREVREVRPNTQIAFLSGYDDFSYAQQAIQYNVVSYMLKPITAQDLTIELKNIKRKIDDKFAEFLGSTQKQGRAEIANFLMPLILDSYQEESGEDREQQLLLEAKECGILTNDTSQLRYTVIVSNFWNEDGKNCTVAENINAIESVLKKYVKHNTFYVGNRIVSLICATSREMNKYLHILVDDIIQSTRRIMELDAHIGISKEKENLQDCHEAYGEAMKAITKCNRDDGLARYISDIERLDEDEKISSGSEICDKALNKIEKEYADAGISLVSISNDIAISPNYLSALIKKHMGSTFIELLTKKRVETAKELLLGSQLKIREITEMCGYSDQHYFSYCFKKYVGMSPNAYRRQSNEGEEN